MVTGIGVDAFLIDLDGVLYTGTTAVPGAQQTLEFLEEHGYPFRFVTNSTRRSRESIAQRLRTLGFSIPASMIFSPAVVAAGRLGKAGKRKVLLLSTGDVHRDFEAAGISTDSPDADAVVVADAGENFTYDRLTYAFRTLLGGADLIALEEDRYWMGDDGLMLSAGPYVTALEYASGRSAVLVGKPSPEFFLQALSDMGISPERAAMVGDDLDSDIGGAKRCGMKGILVMTGKYREDRVKNATIQPDYILSSIATLPDLLIRSSFPLPHQHL